MDWNRTIFSKPFRSDSTSSTRTLAAQCKALDLLQLLAEVSGVGDSLTLAAVSLFNKLKSVSKQGQLQNVLMQHSRHDVKNIVQQRK